MSIIGEAFVRVSPEGAGFASKLQSQLKSAGLGNVGAIAGVAIAAGVVAGLSSIGAEFGKVRRIITQQVGVESKDIEGLFASVRRSAEQVPVSLEKAAAATTLLFKRGVPLGLQLDKLAKQELFLAKITGGDLASTTEKTTSIFAKFNVPLREQSKELDVLFKAQQRSGKSLDELLAPLQAGGASLQAFGFDLDKSTALITQLQIAGVNVQPALAGLRKAFGQLSKEGKDPRKALADLLAEFREAPNSTKAASDAIALFGGRAGPELVAAIKAGKFEFADLLKEITDGKGGIVATGEATLTLGDRITLLRNRVSDAFADLGIKVRSALVGAFVDISEPLVRVGVAVGHLFQAVAPLALVLAPIGLAFKLVVPTLNAFATGLDGIASALAFLHNPLGLAIAGIVLFGLEGLAIIQTIAGVVRAVKALTLALIENPYFLAAAAIVAIGVAISTLRKQADPAIKVAEAFNKAMFTSDSASSIFVDGINSAAEAFDKFISKQLRAGDNKLLSIALRVTGSDVDALTNAVTGSEAGWNAYARGAEAAGKASGASNDAITISLSTLQDQREAFALSARAQAEAAIETNVLTRAQKNALVEQHRFKDGSVDLAGVLDDINLKLRQSVESHNATILAQQSTTSSMRDLAQQLSEGAIGAADAQAEIAHLGLEGDDATKQLDKLNAMAAILTAEQDKLSLSTIATSKEYGVLAQAIADGSVSQIDATQILENMGLSAAGAGTAFSDLQSSIQQFVDGALGALPTVADAVSQFNEAISGDKGTLESDLSKRADLQKQLAAAGGQASDELKKSIIENNEAIRADFQKLAEDNDPKKFTDQLLANAAQVATFTANLQTLVDAHLGPLAGKLASLGPEAAGQLAANLAGDIPKAQQANAAAKLAEAFTGNYKKFLEDNIGPLTLTGEAAGQAVGKGIAKGIIDELLKEIPSLRGQGIIAGDEVNSGAKEGASKSGISDALKAHLGQHIPEFRGLGIPIGTNVGEGTKEGVGRTDLGTSVKTAILRGGGKVREGGVSLGTSAGDGIVAGIRAQFGPVGDAILALTQHGVAVAKGAWKVFSPSQVFTEIGAQVGAGLALGIKGSADDVDAAALFLTSRTTASITDALAGAAQFAPDITPEIVPKVAPIVLPPIDVPTVQITPKLNPIAVPPVTIDAQLGPISPPVVPPVTIDGTIVALPPTFDPVVLSGALAPVAPPQIDPLVIAASLGPVAAPNIAPLTLSGSFAPITPPDVGTIALAGSFGAVAPPSIDPLVLAAAFGPVTPPRVPPVVVDASLSRIAPPQIDPVVVASSLAPFTIPTPPPIEASLAPLPTPTIPPVVLSASLAPFDVPTPPPVSVALAPFDVPTIAPVDVRTRLAPFVLPPIPALDVQTRVAPLDVPALAPLDVPLAPFVLPAVPPLAPIPASLAPIAPPDIAPVVVPASLGALPTPTVPLIEAKFAPLPPISVPSVPPIRTTFAPIVPPRLPALVAQIAPVPPQSIDTAFAGIDAAGERAGVLAAQGVADGLSSVTPTIDLSAFDQTLQRSGESISEWHRRLAELFSQRSGESITEWHRRFAAIVGQIGTDTEELKRFLGGINTTKFAPPAIAAPAQDGFRELLDLAQKALPKQRSGESISEWHRRLHEILDQRPGESINEWRRRFGELFDGFKKSVGQIDDQSEELHRWLAALGGTRLALRAPPSRITIAEAAQSVPVAAPNLRADAQKQQQDVRHVGLFDGANFHVTEQSDALHIASEIAWRLL